MTSLPMLLFAAVHESLSGTEGEFAAAQQRTSGFLGAAGAVCAHSLRTRYGRSMPFVFRIGPEAGPEMNWIKALAAAESLVAAPSPAA
jgi:hypothetical protein